MSDKNKILINDTCVLFDLIDLNLIQDFFQLEYEFVTTPQVIGEITNEEQLSEIKIYISNGSLIVDNEGTFESIKLIFDKYAGLSFADSSVLDLAIRKKGTVLSSDKSLRNISKRIDLSVIGLLWIIEKLYNRKIISLETAMEKLRLYPKVNIRAPIKEISLLINRVEKKL